MTNPPDVRERRRILHAWADTRIQAGAALDIQARQLQISLDRVSEYLEYRPLSACTANHLIMMLNRFRPEILQLSAHGDSEGRIELMHSGRDEASVLTKAQLATILKDRPELQLLVLDCCYGLVGVEALKDCVAAVIGVRGRIREPYPIAFSIALYDAIGSGRSIEAAVQDAIVAAADHCGGGDAFELWRPDAAVGPLHLGSCESAGGASREHRAGGVAASPTSGPPEPASPLASASDSSRVHRRRLAAVAAAAISAAVVVAGVTQFVGTASSPKAEASSVDALRHLAPVAAPQPAATALAPSETFGTGAAGFETRSEAPGIGSDALETRSEALEPRAPGAASASAATLEAVLQRLPPRPPQAHVPAELGVEILVHAPGAKTWLLLADGDAVSDLEDYRVVIWPQTQGFLYVFQVDARGQVDWLFPENPASEFSGGANPVEAGVILSVPESGMLYLDQSTGQEHVFAVLTATRWLELEAVLRSASDLPDPLGVSIDPVPDEVLRGVGGRRPVLIDAAPNGTPGELGLEGAMGSNEWRHWFHSQTWVVKARRSFEHTPRPPLRLEPRTGDGD